MLSRLKASALFQGFRSLPPVDLEALADLLARLGQGAAASKEVEQVDINPLLISNGKPVAVDATVILTQPPHEDETA